MDVRMLCRKAKTAAQNFTRAATVEKNELLAAVKQAIEENTASIKEANEADCNNARQSGIKGAFLDRLTLTDGRIKTMCDGIDDVIALPDYVGKVEKDYVQKDGLHIQKVRSPLGVVGIIYESRPNVTVDAAVLCIKSGNGVVLKGGKEAINTNRVLAQIMKDAFVKKGFDGNLIGFVDGTDRSLTEDLLKCGEYVDVMIPRGSEKLKKYVVETAAMPVIASSGGNCHIFVEKTADFDMAVKVIENAKISRPSVCNALETILAERSVASEFLPLCLENLRQKGVEIRGTAEVAALYPAAKEVGEDEFYCEYEDMIVKVKIVSNLDEAIAHINTYGTGHSDAIMTSDKAAADRFTREVDSAAVYVNASTRFTDGYVFGLGAEMGISTQKLHVRGPIGLEELTSLKYVITGQGHVR